MKHYDRPTLTDDGFISYVGRCVSTRCTRSVAESVVKDWNSAIDAEIAAAVEEERKRIISERPWDTEAMAKITQDMRQDQAIADSVRAAVPEGSEIDLERAPWLDGESDIISVYTRPKQPQAKPCPKCGKPATHTADDESVWCCSGEKCSFYYCELPLADWNSIHYGPQPDLREAQAKAWEEGVQSVRVGVVADGRATVQTVENPYRTIPPAEEMTARRK